MARSKGKARSKDGAPTKSVRCERHNVLDCKLTYCRRKGLAGRTEWVARFSSGLYMKQGGIGEPDTTVTELSEATKFKGLTTARKVAERTNAEAMTVGEAEELDAAKTAPLKPGEKLEVGVHVIHAWDEEEARRLGVGIVKEIKMCSGVDERSIKVRWRALQPVNFRDSVESYGWHRPKDLQVVYIPKTGEIPVTEKPELVTWWGLKGPEGWLVEGVRGLFKHTKDVLEASLYSTDDDAEKAKSRARHSVEIDAVTIERVRVPVKTTLLAFECSCRAAINFDVTAETTGVTCPVCSRRWLLEDALKASAGEKSVKKTETKYRCTDCGKRVREKELAEDAEDDFPLCQGCFAEREGGGMPELVVPAKVLAGLVELLEAFVDRGDEDELPKNMVPARTWIRALTRTVQVKCLGCREEHVFAELSEGRCRKCQRPHGGERTTKDRKTYHDMLDRAMDETEEGSSFLPEFTKLVLEDVIDLGPTQ